MEALAQLRYKNEGAQNNSSPYDLNLDLLEVFSWKITPRNEQIGCFHANIHENM